MELDINYLNKFTNQNVKTYLKKTYKGSSIVAKKPIKKGNTIAYYRFTVFGNEHTPIVNNMYAMSVYTKSGRISEAFIGDVTSDSVFKPIHNIPCWGYISNEPDFNQEANCELVLDLKKNYRNRSRVKRGDTMIYRLVATRNIQPQEEVVWCYGDSYERKYKANC